ncbi:MAG: glycosyltransferase 87 family protein [Microbacteriaceae bacterium]
MSFDSAPISGRSALSRFLRSPVTLWVAFIAVHVVLGELALVTGKAPLGDVTTAYQPWAAHAVQTGSFPGIQTPWVYPIGALPAILAPLLAGEHGYVAGWLVLVLLFDAAAFAAVIHRRTRRRVAAAWWWLGFLLLLGPIAVSRLDALSVALAVVGLVAVASRPHLATVLLTIATWIKVWPAAILAAMVVSMRHRWRIIGLAALASAAIAAIAVALGSGPNVFSFIGTQADRGLQIEAPISAAWMWAAGLHRPGNYIYYDQKILTFQVTGDGIGTAIAVMTPLLLLAVVAVLLTGIRAAAAGRSATDVLPTLSLALVTTTIAFNKVGSPQYVAWLAAPVIIGLILRGKEFRTPAILVAATAALTQIVYPVLYVYLLYADLAMITVLTLRNVLFFVILGWAMWALWTAGRTVEPGPGLRAGRPRQDRTEDRRRT